MQHAIRPTKDPVHANISVPGAKSITYRALLLAALADGVSEVSGIYLNSHIQTFIKALHQLGIVAQLDENAKSCIIAGGNGKFPKKQTSIWCQDSKTTLRLLLAACAATPGVFYFDGSPQLHQQPITHLTDALQRQGAQLIPSDTHKLPFTLIGSDTLLGGNITTSTTHHHQLISALLMIAPFARSPCQFTLTHSTHATDIDLTSAIMAEYGVLVHRIHQGQLMVPVPQRYQAKDYTVEPDLALAIYFLSAAAITAGEITIKNAKRSLSKQSDAKFFSVLENMGCHLRETNAGLTLKGPTTLLGTEISMQKFSHAFLALAAMAPFASTPTCITHLSTPKTREANRMLAMKAALLNMDIRVETGENWIRIYPGTPKPTSCNANNDPQIAMALAIIGLKTKGMMIEHAERVTDIFPDFFTQWDKLASNTNVNA